MESEVREGRSRAGSKAAARPGCRAGFRLKQGLEENEHREAENPKASALSSH